MLNKIELREERAFFICVMIKQFTLNNRLKNQGSIYKTFKTLPDWMQALGLEFLILLESFHDTDENWNVNGLSVIGHSNMNKLISRFITSLQ